MNWLTAFLLTEAVEAPVYLALGRGVPLLRRLLVAFGASAVTHPVLWFAFPWDRASWWWSFVIGECLVVIVEGALAWLAGFRFPWLVALAANAASVVVGLLISWIP